jgi:hypothetical protein
MVLNQFNDNSINNIKDWTPPSLSVVMIVTHTITTPTHNIALIGSYKAVEEQIGNFGGFCTPKCLK